MAWVLKTPTDPYYLTTSLLVAAGLLTFLCKHTWGSAPAFTSPGKTQVFSFADIYLFLKKMIGKQDLELELTKKVLKSSAN